MISKKLKFRQYEYTSSYQKQKRSKLISTTKSYQPSLKSRIEERKLQKEKFKVYRQQIKTSSAYQPSTKSRLEIKISSAYPKYKEKQLISYPKKYQEKEYELKQKDIELKQEREELEEKQREKYFESFREKPIKEPHRHITEIYECTCFVSDRKLNHFFACKPEQIDILGSFEALHNNYYPDHQLISYEFHNTFSIEDKGFYRNDSITEKQKDFLRILGLSNEEISLLNNKRIASKVISKRR